MLPLQLGIGSGTRTEQMCRVTKLLSFGTMNNVIRSSSDEKQDECFRQAQDLMQVQRRAFFLGWKVDLFCYIFLAYCTLIQLKNVFKRKVNIAKLDRYQICILFCFPFTTYQFHQCVWW
eukprot:TRINITY_DN5391_c0_g1_i11.p1 TRINITY_DN5391_c0_g1~~TRINITY_DN5391_c0_g1_i11.p1  ORF type:complete len:119 (-),score=4.20 TRINITY_DN5391_c0_g1_i11:10-366(-)